MLRKAEKAENWSQMKDQLEWRIAAKRTDLTEGSDRELEFIWSGESLPKKSDQTGWSASGVCTGCLRRGHTT